MITNKQKIILQKIYISYKSNLKLENSDSIENRIIIGIKSIECFNRNIIWRFFEYIYLLTNYMLGLSRNKIENLSIGVFQLKINMILDFLDIEYTLDQRIIKLKNRKHLIQILKNRNNPDILKRLLLLNNAITKNEINVEKFVFFLLEYSRNIDFDSDFNYKTILYSLIENQTSKWINSYAF